MKINIDEHIELRLFDSVYSADFFDSIHRLNITNDTYRANLQKKYTSIEKILKRIDDAIENKFKIDGTPDFFIYFNGDLAGVFEFHPLTDDDFVEIGFWLFSEFRRKGILSKVIPEMITYAKEHFSKSKILATTSMENGAAQGLLESNQFCKIGLTEERDLNLGTVEKQFIYELIMMV